MPEDEIDSQGNEIENNIQIDDKHSNGNWSCCGMTDFHMNLHYFQHGNDSNDYTFDLPDEHEIYEVGFRIGALNNDGTVTYTHTDETTQENILEGQDNTDIQNMFEDVVYNIYDTLETFIDSFTITINDWSLLDDISFKYVTTTTTTSTTTTTIYIPPPPDPEPEPELEPEVFEVIMDDGTISEYTEAQILDGDQDRDNERKRNFEIYGVELTDAQIERGDLENYDIEIIEDENMDQDREELSDDVDIPDLDEDRLENERELEAIPEEITDEEMEEFIDTIFEVEEFLEDFEEVEIIIIEDLEDLDINLELEDIKIPEKEEKFDDWDTEFEEIEEEFIEEEIIEEIEEEILEEILPEEITKEEYKEIKDKEKEDLTLEEEIILVEVVEEIIEQVVDVEELETVFEENDIEILEQEELDNLSEEEQIIYEEELEEVVEEFVESLTVDELTTVVEQVAEVSVESLEVADTQTQKIVQAVVTEVVSTEVIEDLTEQEVESVAEVLNVEAEDVEIYAELVETDEVVEQAVEEYVERAIENADSSLQPYNLADVQSEIRAEQLLADPVGTLLDVDLAEISFAEITSMPESQKEKAQEVLIPVVLTRIASMFSMVTRRTG